MGGGPSAKSFDYDTIRGELTIGVNRAFELFDPTFIFGMDARFWNWLEQGKFGEGARDRFNNYEHGYKVWLRLGNAFYPEDFVQVPASKNHMGQFTSSIVDGLGSGNNSGFAALNLAYVLGVSEIWLVGFDMHGDGERQQWWHNGYPEVQREDVYEDFRYRISRYAAPALHQAGVRVYNLCEDSALTCFPKAPYGLPPEGWRLPVVVSYYTEGTGYEAHARRLKESLRLWGLERDIVAVSNLGSWQKNTQYKAIFIRQMMEKHVGRPLLYLDADATMERYPEKVLELPGRCSIAAHVRQGKELLSGTLWLSNDAMCWDLVNRWISTNERNPDRWDQKNLWDAIAGGSMFENLPPEYCAIFDGMPEAGDSPVIMQWQASRELKWQVEK